MESDGSHITAVYAGVLTVLFAARLFYGFCEAALKEQRYGRGLKNAFSLHKSFNSALSGITVLLICQRLRLTDNFSSPPSAVIIAAIAAVCFLTLICWCDMLPERLIKDDRTASKKGRAADLLTMLFYIPSALGEALCRITARLTGNDPVPREDSVTEEEILNMVNEGNETGSIEPSEKEMINNVFEFHEMTVSEVMTHRTDMVAVSIDSEVSDVVVTAINSGFSRIPVYKESIDNIEGMIYVKDLLCLISTQSAEGLSVRSFLRDAEFVPQSCPCDELFKRLTADRLQIAIAVDEYGGTAGLVTMEDLVEAIVGNIRDEYDNESEDMVKISDNVYTVSGTADPADVMEALGCPLPADSAYDTMSAFVTDLLGKIPEDGETPGIRYENITFTVLLAEDMRIEKLKAVIDNG